MIKPTRFYLDRRDSGLAKLCWFSENKENEMMFGFCGLSSKVACFANQYEDRYVSREEMINLRINYKDAELRKQKELADHFIMHKDGRFHLKLKSEDERYVHKVKLLAPISNKIEEFLDFFIISDIAFKYERAIKQPKNPYGRIPVSATDFVILRGRFSGANFSLEQTVAEEEILRVKKTNITSPGILLKGKIFKGIFTFQIMDSKSINFSNRPEGTYVLIAFPTEIDKFLIKTFVFN